MRLSIVLLAVISILPAFGDTLRLRSGKVVTGTYLGGSARQVRFEVGDKVETYDLSDVSAVEFQSGASASAAPATPVATPAPAAAAAPAPAAPAPAPVATPAPATQERASTLRTDSATQSTADASNAPANVEIPAGTNLVVRMIDSVDSETAAVGQEFRASLDEPIMVGGQVVVPRNSDVTIKLVEDKQAGKISGRTELTVDVVNMKVNGRTVDVNTQAVTQSGGSRGKRTGVMAGGGAALGAIIGGIAGGGKGAAIGAVSGAGAGTAAGAMTKGSTVKIPSETRLTFTMEDPLRI